MNTATIQIKNFEIENGLGKISFSSELIGNIIKKILSSFSGYEYVAHTIESINTNYYEVSIYIKSNVKFNCKQITRLQKELLLAIKQSLSLTCAVIVNIENE